MKIHLDHAGYTDISTTQAGNAEVWVAAGMKREDGVWFYLTRENVKKLHKQLGEWLEERHKPAPYCGS